MNLLAPVVAGLVATWVVRSIAARWRRRPRALLPDAWRSDELRREAEYHTAMERWHANPDGRPAPTMIPSAGIPSSR